MLKNISKLELKVGEKTYQFLCDNDSPLNDIKEAIFQFQKYVGVIEDQIKAQMEAQAKAASEAMPVTDEIKPEV
jgi:hypothetical protein